MRYTELVKDCMPYAPNHKGFTLIELLVAISIFTIFISILISVFTSFLQYQRISQNERQVIDTVSGVIDTISREVRLGSKYRCAVGSGTNSNCKCLIFTDQLGRTVKYNLTQSDRLDRAVGSFSSNSCPTNEKWVPVTEAVIQLDNTKSLFNIETIGQPRVRVRLIGDYTVDGDTREIDLSTQITQRILQIGSDSERLARFIVGTNIKGSLSRIAYGFDSDGNCKDELGESYEDDSNCEIQKEIKDVVYASGKGLYVLTQDRFVFLIPSSNLSFSGGENNITIVPNGVIGTINRNIERVGRGQDLREVIALYPASGTYRIYARTSNNVLYGITGDVAVRISSDGDINVVSFITQDEFSDGSSDSDIGFIRYNKNREALNSIFTNIGDIANGTVIQDETLLSTLAFLSIINSATGLLRQKGETETRLFSLSSSSVPPTSSFCPGIVSSGEKTIPSVQMVLKALPTKINDSIKDVATANNGNITYLLKENGKVVYCRKSGGSISNEISGIPRIKDLLPTKDAQNFIYAITESEDIVKINLGSANILSGDAFCDSNQKIDFITGTSFDDGKQFFVGRYKTNAFEKLALFAHKDKNGGVASEYGDESLCPSLEIRKYDDGQNINSGVSIYRFTDIEIKDKQPSG